MVTICCYWRGVGDEPDEELWERRELKQKPKENDLLCEDAKADCQKDPGFIKMLA